MILCAVIKGGNVVWTNMIRRTTLQEVLDEAWAVIDDGMIEGLKISRGRGKSNDRVLPSLRKV
jgi:hypothetical protein